MENNEKIKTPLGEKLIKSSFWVISAIHIAVFTSIGALTGQWRLLIVFLVGFVLLIGVWAGIKISLARQKTRKS
jgi:hypothetical protein